MYQVVFESALSMFERAKTVHASERAATMIGYNITRMFKSRRQRSLVHVAHTSKTRNVYNILIRKLYEKYRVEGLAHM
jgi:hypothetical protein